MYESKVRNIAKQNKIKTQNLMILKTYFKLISFL